MTDEWVAAAGLRYPAGDEEYEKAVAGKSHKVVFAQPGDVCNRIPAKSVEAYLKQGREVIVPKAEWDARQKEAEA